MLIFTWNWNGWFFHFLPGCFRETFGWASKGTAKRDEMSFLKLTFELSKTPQLTIEISCKRFCRVLTWNVMPNKSEVVGKQVLCFSLNKKVEIFNLSINSLLPSFAFNFRKSFLLRMIMLRTFVKTAKMTINIANNSIKVAHEVTWNKKRRVFTWCAVKL